MNIGNVLHHKRFYVLIFLILTVLFSFPLFIRLNNIGSWDWDQHLANAEAPRKTVLEYRQTPLWNPYWCGGMSGIGNPKNEFLSPFFLFILAFGTNIGFKILLPVTMFLGLYGMFLLARYFQISKSGSILASIIFNCSGLFLLPFIAGMPQFLSLYLLPWITLFFLKSIKDSDYRTQKSIITGILITFVFFNGFNYVGEILVYLFVLCCIEIYVQKSIIPLKYLALVLITFSGLSAISLFPSIELMQKYPRYPRFEDGYSVASLLYSLFSRQQTFQAFGNYFGGMRASFINGATYELDANGMYVGILGGLLFLYGIIVVKKNALLLRLSCFIFLWLMFGKEIVPSLFSLVHTLPMLNMMRAAQRYNYYFMTALVLCAGIGFDKFSSTILSFIPGKARLMIRPLIIVVIIADIWTVSWMSAKTDAFTVRPVSVPVLKNFQQIVTGENQSWPYTIAGYGVMNCYESIPVPLGNVKSAGSDGYRGEIYFTDIKSRPVIAKWTPNRVDITFSEKRIANTSIVMNQNYDSNWWGISNSGDVRRAVPYQQLISVPVFPKDTSITLFYLPVSFLTGLIVSAASLVCLIILWFRNRRHFRWAVFFS